MTRIRHAKPEPRDDDEIRARNGMPTTGTPALNFQVDQPPPLSTLDTLLEQVKKAAEERNSVLVQDRCQKILELCAPGAVRAVESRSRTMASAPSSSQPAKKPGGVAYIPEYLLQIVLLADDLTLCLQGKWPMVVLEVK